MSPLTSLPDRSRRAAITGIGAIAATGVGTEAWWEATKHGTLGIRRISRFDPSKYATRCAGEVEGFEATDHIDRRLIVQTDRWTWLGLAAAHMALDDARVDPGALDPYSMSVITASSSGGNEFGQAEIQNLWGKGPGFVGAYQSIAWFYAATTGQISIRHQMKGPCGVVAAEGAGGLEALAHARRTIRREVDTVVGGGVEAPIGPYALTCQIAGGSASTADDPAAYRPFDARAAGWFPGEGGAMLLVEDLEAARRRGVQRIYGTIAGCGASHDPVRQGRPGQHLARALRGALDDAGVGPADVDVVFADGAATRTRDAEEAAALHDVFGRRSTPVPVTVPKTMVGRLHAGGAALDVAAALLAMRDSCIPPTVNVVPDGYDLDLVVEAARPARIDIALVVARGHGGFNRATVLRAPEDG